nr:protein free1 [Quercus suber]
MELDEVNELAANVTSVNELKSRQNAIWKLQVQNRIKLLMWRAGSDSLPTKVNLTKRMLLTETTCTQCNQGPEDTLHALWTCPQLYEGFGRTWFDLGSDPYGKRLEESPCYDSICDEGAYAYEGGKVEPYGARGIAPKSSTWVPMFEDYGRSIGFCSGKDSTVTSNSSKIVRAVPEAKTQQDVKSRVQKFWVKLLPESLEFNSFGTAFLRIRVLMATTACFIIVSRNDIPIYEAEVGSAAKV